jgi:hypothetical protein
MEENCRGGQGLNWAVEPRGKRERERENQPAATDRIMSSIIAALHNQKQQ